MSRTRAPRPFCERPFHLPRFISKPLNRARTKSISNRRLLQRAYPGTTEQYILNYQWRENKDPVFGQVRGRSRWVDRYEVTEDGLKEGLDELEEGKLIEVTGGDLDGNWSATHIWGLLEIEGERKHVRKVVVKRKNGDEVRVMMVYDWAE